MHTITTTITWQRWCLSRVRRTRGQIALQQLYASGGGLDCGALPAETDGRVVALVRRMTSVAPEARPQVAGPPPPHRTAGLPFTCSHGRHCDFSRKSQQ